VAAAGVAAFVGSVTWAGPAQGSPAVLAAESAYAATSTVAATVVPCRPADLSATLVLTPVGGSSSSLAGAVVLADTSHRSCSLRGVPKVRVVGPSGQAVSVFEAPGGARHARPVTLQGSPSTARRPDAGTSITWSAWSCAKGSFALAVQFSGWKGPITVPWGSTAGYTGTPCSGGEATIYVGPVARAAAATP
jgi:hypothetical protein